MKILYFHQHFSTPEGASGIRSYEMARRLIARGHEVIIVCGSYKGGVTGLDRPFVNGSRRGVVDGINIIEFNLSYANSDHFNKRAWVFIQFALFSIKLIFTEHYDLIFATTTPLTAGIPGIVGRWLRGKKFVFEVRDLWPELPKAMGVIRNPLLLWAMASLEWLSYHSAQALIGLSPGIVEGITQKGISPNRVIMIPNGCDLAIFESETQSWMPPDIQQTDFLAVFAGTHGLANGLSAVLDAAFELKKRQRDDIKILLIGQGKLKPELQQRAQQEQLDNIMFCDPISKHQLASLFNNAHLGLQILANIPAFYYGTSPNKFFDYIAAGLPVLNNYPGWLADLITDNQCGFIVPPNDPKRFADTLEYAANNRFLLKKMGDRCKKLARQNFNRDDLANVFVDWLECAVK